MYYPPKAVVSDNTTNPTSSPSIDPQKRTRISVLKFQDKRTNKNIVGEVRNGFGMRTADVVPVNSVEEWFGNAINFELKKGGYEVIPEVIANYGDGTSILSGVMQNVYSYSFFTYNSIVTFDVKLTKDNKLIHEKRYNGKDEESINMAATSSGYADSLSMALYRGIAEFIEDLKKIPLEN